MIEFRNSTPGRTVLAYVREDKRPSHRYLPDYKLSDALVLIYERKPDLTWLSRTVALWNANEPHEFVLRTLEPSTEGTWEVSDSGELNHLHGEPLALAEYVMFQAMLPVFDKIKRRRVRMRYKKL